MKKYKILLSLFALMSLVAVSQTESPYYYYYKGEKSYLEKDFQTIGITFQGEENIPAVIAFFRAHHVWNDLSAIVEDETRRLAKPINTDQTKIKAYYAVVKTSSEINEEDYNAACLEFRSLPGMMHISPCFFGSDHDPVNLTNNLFVKLKNGSSLDLLTEVAQKYRLEIVGYTWFPDTWYILSCGKNTATNAVQAASRLYETGLFELTEPEMRIKGTQSSSDPNYSSQWSLKNTGQNGGTPGIDINVEPAWNITKGNANARVAIYDDGFEMNHPDLQNNIEPSASSGYDAMSNTYAAQIYGEHGTNCAGIVSAEQNNIGVSGVAPMAKIYPMSINFGSPFPTATQWANGFWTAAQNIGTEVISCSWKLSTTSSVIDNSITYALNSARNGKGVVVVFASGNNNNSNGEYPANSNPDILVVGGVDRCGWRSGQAGVTSGHCDPWCPTCKMGSSFGTSLDVVAGGTSIHTTDRQGAAGNDPSDYDPGFDGTSAACPAVAGVAALMMSVYPDMTRNDVNYFICLTAQKLSTYWYQVDPNHPISTWNNETGYGLVDAYNAVLFAAEVNCNNNPNINITSNVSSPQNLVKSAANTINASSIVNSGAIANYRAGNEVRLSPGFQAVSGSKFHAYIQGCAGPFQFKQPQSNNDLANSSVDTKGFLAMSEKRSTITLNDELEVFPNPTTGKFTVDLKSSIEQPHKIVIHNMLGSIISVIKPDGSSKYEIDLTGKDAGVYLVSIHFDGKIVTKRMAKE